MTRAASMPEALTGVGHRPGASCDIRGFRNATIESFLDTFTTLGCTRTAPVPLSTGVDPSVHFVGAAICGFKDTIANELIPARGLAVAQPAFRARNATRLLEPGFQFEWGGYFTNIALIAPVERLSELFGATMTYFATGLRFDSADVLLQVSAADGDLCDLASTAPDGIDIAVDRCPPKAYQHTIGMPDITGRNLNVALRIGATPAFRDVGNIIIFRNARTGYRFIELGFGDTTITRARFGLAHVLDAFDFPTVIADPLSIRVLQDTSLVCLALIREGLEPSSRDARTKILGKYMRALCVTADRCGLVSQMPAYLTHVEVAEFGSVLATPTITNFLARQPQAAPATRHHDEGNS